MSKHSIRRGKADRCSTGAKRLQGLVVGGGALPEARLIREGGVPRREVHEAALLATPGRQHLHPAPGAAAEPLGDGVRLLDVGRQVHFGRHRTHLVELRNGGLQHVGLAGGGSALALGHQLDALDDAAAAHEKHEHHGAGGADLHAEDVAVAQLGPRHLLLLFVQCLHRAHRVAQLPGPFVVLGGCSFHHPQPQLLDQLVAPALEEELRVLHRVLILPFRADGVHARSETPVDVVLETRAPALAVDDLVARADPEEAVRQRHGLPCEPGRQEGTRVHVSIPLHPPRHQHTRERLARGQLQVRVALVVP